MAYPYRRAPHRLDYGQVALSEVRKSQGPALRCGGIVVALLTCVVLLVFGVANVWLTVALWRVSPPAGLSCVTFWLGMGLWLWNGKLWRR